MKTEIYVKYVRNKVVLVPLDVTVDSTFDQLLSMIYSKTCIDKEKFKLVLNFRCPLKMGIGSDLVQYGMTILCHKC